VFDAHGAQPWVVVREKVIAYKNHLVDVVFHFKVSDRGSRIVGETEATSCP